MEQKGPTDINSIPPELLDHIFSLLVQPPPSPKRLYDQPFHDITQSTVVTLKSCSCVSQRWRRAVLPILFQNARMLLRMDTVERNWPIQVPEFLAFVSRSNCQSKIKGFTLVVQDPRPERYNYDDFEGGLDSLKDLWQLLFNVIDPLRLTIVAPPPVLGALVALGVNLEEVDEYHMPYHILSLDRPPSPTSAHYPKRHIPNGTTLLNLCPWESLLLNEGSFIRSYTASSYLFTIMQSPSILRSLGTNDSWPELLLPKTIKSVSYIAIFPEEHHSTYLYGFLLHIQRLYIQFTPRHDLYPDTLQKGSADVNTMTAARKYASMTLLKTVLSEPTAFPNLTEIEYGDTKVDPSWQSMVEKALSRYPGRWALDPQRECVMVRTPHGRCVTCKRDDCFHPLGLL